MKRDMDLVRKILMAMVCSGLIAPDTLIRDNLNPILRCHYESETTI
jgi:hypothetical protein